MCANGFSASITSPVVEEIEAKKLELLVDLKPILLQLANLFLNLVHIRLDNLCRFEIEYASDSHIQFSFSVGLLDCILALSEPFLDFWHEIGAELLACLVFQDLTGAILS